jgi:hypothetical protein
MTKANVFISFDFDHDRDLRDLLLSQDKILNKPFQMTDWSVEELLTDAWTLKIRERIKKVDQVVFLCGEHTNIAKGVGVEFAITKEEGKPYFLLQGRMNKATRKPSRAEQSDKVYAWTIDNLNVLVGGAR